VLSKQGIGLVDWALSPDLDHLRTKPLLHQGSSRGFRSELTLRFFKIEKKKGASNQPIRVFSVAKSEQHRGDMRERWSLPLDIGIFHGFENSIFGISRSGSGILLPRKSRFVVRTSWRCVFLAIAGTFPYASRPTNPGRYLLEVIAENHRNR
jgi:hypothetical protein